MTQREFCYWLDGFFNLEENLSTITLKQLHIIESHLNLVKTIDPQLTGFVKWLNNKFSSLNKSDQAKDMLQILTRQIKSELNAIDIKALSLTPFSPNR